MMPNPYAWESPDWIRWASRLDSLSWRALGCSVWDLAAADEYAAYAIHEDGGKPSDYLRAILKPSTEH